MAEENEFDNLDVDVAPEAELAGTPNQGEDIIMSGTAGTKYDWTKAPEGVKAPPRQNLDGQVLTLQKVDLILPPINTKWDLTKSGDKEFKYVSFIMYYENGQQEFYSGVRTFKRVEGGVVKYSHPTITRDRMNQASKLLGIYADYKKKDINEISLREFLAFLNSAPKVKIKCDEVKNPQTKEVVVKNFIGEFVPDSQE